MTKTLLNFSDVAKQAGVDRTTLYNWKRNGRFNIKPHGNYKPYRWHIDDIRAWLKPDVRTTSTEPQLFEG